ncbi:MAG TPA: AAA family ATPase [Gaiellaceae bacterium]|nr:AAA family ATPase [Gaiellaceae bacterium]
MQPDVVGRERELALVDAFFEKGLPAALVVEGEAGIGKTALWRAGVDAASERGFRLLRCAPTGEEAQLAFAGLSDVLAPVQDLFTALPEPQRRALEIALLLRESDGPPPEERAIGAATAAALRTAAREGPILVACDDVQWLDAASRAALRFALRRLDAPVALLAARRTTRDSSRSPTLESAIDEASLVRIEVGPLTLGALSRILRSRSSIPLSRPLLSRIQEASAGNPFYALELLTVLERRQESLSPGDPLPVPTSVNALVSERIAALPSGALRVVELAALLAEPTAPTVELAGGSAESFRSAQSAGVIELVGDRIEFTHPLLKAATTASMTPGCRRALHGRLAEVLPPGEEHARQLAAATEEPDELVARALVQAADELAARGARWASAELYDEAVRLTPDDLAGVLPQRLLAAAQAWFAALDWPRATARAEEALAHEPGPDVRVDAVLLVASCLEDPDRVVELAESESEGDGDDALRARLWTIVADGKLNVDSRGALAAGREALRYAERAEDETLLPPILTLIGVLETMRCEGAARETLERGVEVESRVGEVDLSLSPSYALGIHAFLHDELDEARTLFARHLERARATGDDVSQAHTLWQLAYVEFKAGDWNLAREYADSSYDLYEGSGNVGDTTTALFAGAVVDACRGRREAVEERCRLAVELGGERPRILEQVGLAVGMLELGLERYSEAADAFLPSTTGWIDPGHRLITPNQIEALVGAGRLHEAEQLLEDWEALGRRLDRPRALATAARARGLLDAARGDHEAAAAALDEAVAQHDRFECPFERARTLLALGAQLRRAGKRSAARGVLDEAAVTFAELEATPWHARATREAARISGRRRTAYDELTDAERRVAELVAEGRSNKDVASALFISVKTVEVTLTRVYRKLGVRSRVELARRFADEDKD